MSPGDTGKEIWEQALGTFFCGDKELIDYVQATVGMAAIGKVYQEHMIIAYGGGANGKSTFWNTIFRVLGTYAGKISADTLTMSCKHNTRPEAAELKGKRLIIAYETWSAWDAQGREWKMQKDVSIHGADSQKCELVTPILNYSDIETLQELVRRLRKAGAKSDYTRGCGVHIHIGAKGHTPQTLRNLANIMASHESLLKDALALDDYRVGRYCRPVDPDFLKAVNKKKPQSMSALADVWYESNGANYGRSHHYNDSRYHMLNLHATFTKGTIEFRLFQFDAPANGKLNGLPFHVEEI